MRTQQPDVVGLSVMTFQRATARRIIALIASMASRTHASSWAATTRASRRRLDASSAGRRRHRPRRGRLTFRDWLRALHSRSPVLSRYAGLWYRRGRRSTARPAPGDGSIEDGAVKPPNRDRRACSPATRCSAARRRRRDLARLHVRLQLLLDHRDARPQLSTASRCSRVLDDIADARRRGARAIFLVDDNITIDVPRFEALCRAIVDAGLNDVDYIVQGMTAPIAAHGATLAPLMQHAGSATCSSASRMSSTRIWCSSRHGRRTASMARVLEKGTRHSTRSPSCTDMGCWSSAG